MRVGGGTALVAMWAVLVASGMLLLWRYSAQPGTAAAAPITFPASGGLELENDRVTIVMLAHPHCPCTRSSIGELAVLMSRVGDRARAHVFFVQPEGETDAWVHSDLWAAATAIPNVSAHVDPEGKQARRFGAETSGQVVVYDARGELRYQGGLTEARGHFGDSAGLAAVLAIVRDDAPPTASAPVYGCGLAVSSASVSHE